MHLLLPTTTTTANVRKSTSKPFNEMTYEGRPRRNPKNRFEIIMIGRCRLLLVGCLESNLIAITRYHYYWPSLLTASAFFYYTATSLYHYTLTSITGTKGWYRSNLVPILSLLFAPVLSLSHHSNCFHFVLTNFLRPKKTRKPAF